VSLSHIAILSHIANFSFFNFNLIFHHPIMPKKARNKEALLATILDAYNT
jgi:hypothetical protein